MAKENTAPDMNASASSIERACIEKGMKMTDQRRREVWGLLIFTAAIEYFLTIWSPEELQDIEKRLKAVKKNKPVYHLLGWAYYHGLHNWACRFAARTKDVAYLDWMSTSCDQNLHWKHPHHFREQSNF